MLRTLRLIVAFAALAFATPVMAQEAPTAVRPLANAAATGAIVISTRPVTLYGLSVATGGTAGHVLVFDAAAVPADGAVTPVYCRHVAANGDDAITLYTPARFAVGLVVVFSTTGCWTKTVSDTAFFSYSVR